MSVRVNEAVRVPGAVGANVTLIVQLPPGATELPQMLGSKKSPALVPATWMLLMVKVAFPVLVRIRSWDPLVDPTG